MKNEERFSCASGVMTTTAMRLVSFGCRDGVKLADVPVVDGDVVADISILEDRSRFMAVMQGGVVTGGREAVPRS